MTTSVSALASIHTTSDATENTRGDIARKINGILDQLGNTLRTAYTDVSKSANSILTNVASGSYSRARYAERTLSCTLGNADSSLARGLDNTECRIDRTLGDAENSASHI